MFNNYQKHYDKFIEYVKTISAQINTSDIDSGFINIDALFISIYGHCIKEKYKAKYATVNEKIIFIDASVETYEKTKDLKIESLSDYMHKEFAYIDTLKKMSHYIIFNGSAYIFTDYGLIQMYGRKNEGSEISKISNITILVSKEQDKDELEAFINKSLVEIPQGTKPKNLTICINGTYGIRESSLEIKPFNCDIKDNYNDDLPYERLNELINSEDEELILLHGDPGTGKTSIIRKLIYDNPSVDFIYFDFNLLSTFSEGKVFDFLSEHKQHVLIIEDCEKLFIDRNNGNQFINSMLNLTDGIIGEAFNIKFICTFNCPKSKIDKAVMREGRLSLIYEFKKLSLEKTQKHIPSATQPMTLAEIYNNTHDNGNKNTEKRIGFSM